MSPFSPNRIFSGGTGRQSRPPQHEEPVTGSTRPVYPSHNVSAAALSVTVSASFGSGSLDRYRWICLPPRQKPPSKHRLANELQDFTSEPFSSIE
jgi:hypothetical protein